MAFSVPYARLPEKTKQRLRANARAWRAKHVPINVKTREWNVHSAEIQQRYHEGESPADLAKIFPFTKGAIKEYLRRRGLLRTQSSAAKLATVRGKKAAWLSRLIEVSRTTNRYNPAKGRKGKANSRWIADRTKLKNLVLEQSFVNGDCSSFNVTTIRVNFVDGAADV